MAPSLFLPEDFEGGANNDVVTTENTIFDGIDYSEAPYLESEVIFTTEKAHSGTKSITGIEGGYSDVFLGYNQTTVTADPEDFFFWCNAEPDQDNPDFYTYVYVMQLAALGAIRAEEYDYRGVAIYPMGHPTDPTKVRWWVEFEDAEWTTSGEATQIIIEAPWGEWVKINPKIDALGNMTVTISDEDAVYGTAESEVEGLAQLYADGQYFCFHQITMVNDNPWGHIWVDDINKVSAPVDPEEPVDPVDPPVAGPGEYIVYPAEDIYPSGEIFPGNNVLPGGGPINIEWDKPGERYFQTGLDHGVLYPKNGDPVPWNGLTGLDEAGGGTKTILYRDGRIFYADVEPGDFEGSLTCLFYPDEFAACAGIPQVTDGFYVDDQKPQRFSLSYRTLVGSGLTGDIFGHQIHLVYNATAVIGTRSRKSTTNSPEMMEFNFDLTAVPVKLPGMRPSAHYIIDTRFLDKTTIGQLETILYGSGDIIGRLPHPQELFDLMHFGSAITITDNGDGTWTARGSNANIIDNGDGTFTIKNVNGTDNGDGTFTIEDTP